MTLFLKLQKVENTTASYKWIDVFKTNGNNDEGGPRSHTLGSIAITAAFLVFLGTK